MNENERQRLNPKAVTIKQKNITYNPPNQIVFKFSLCTKNKRADASPA